MKNASLNLIFKLHIVAMLILSSFQINAEKQGAPPAKHFSLKYPHCLKNYKHEKGNDCSNVEDGINESVFIPKRYWKKFKSAIYPSKKILSNAVAHYKNNPCTSTYLLKQDGVWGKVSLEQFCKEVTSKKWKKSLLKWNGGCC